MTEIMLISNFMSMLGGDVESQDKLKEHPMIQVTAFKWVPDFAQGSVRDIRVRWALEEASLGYDDRLIGFEDQSTPAYRSLQPFGQVPAYSDGKVQMFESGAIVLWIAQNSSELLPDDLAGRAMVMTWLFAAMNSVEPLVAELAGKIG